MTNEEARLNFRGVGKRRLFSNRRFCTPAFLVASVARVHHHASTTLAYNKGVCGLQSAPLLAHFQAVARAAAAIPFSFPSNNSSVHFLFIVFFGGPFLFVTHFLVFCNRRSDRSHFHNVKLVDLKQETVDMDKDDGEQASTFNSFMSH